MRLISCLIAVLFVVQAYGLDKVELNSTIKEVTVFVQGAEIVRTVKTNVKKGRSLLVFPELSPYFDANSVQVNGKGAFTILSVKTGYDYLRNRPLGKEVKILQDSLEYYVSELNRRKHHVELIQKEEQLVLANRQVGSQEKGVTAEELKKLADFYRMRLHELYDKREAAEADIKRMNERKNRIQQQINAWNGQLNNKFGEVYVEVASNQAETADIELIYLVSNASWRPSYNIRSTNISSDIQIEYLANIVQNTQEDWSQVNLKISTGFPLQRATKPEVHPWALNFVQQALQGSYQSNRAYEMAEVALDDAPMAKSERLALKANSLTTSVNGQLATTFSIAIPYDIESGAQEQVVQIDQLKLPSTYSYFAAPKYSDYAFLLGRVTGWSGLNLMPGDANVFFEGAYVSKTYFNPFQTNDTLDITLGQDRSIAISRNRTCDHSKERAIAGKKLSTIGIGIVIRNNKRVEIPIIIKDQIPISRIKDIEVSLDESGNAHVEEATGILTWKAVIQPSTSIEKKFEYTVKFPKGRPINL